jgi:ERCC4-type nuclease
VSLLSHGPTSVAVRSKYLMHYVLPCAWQLVVQQRPRNTAAESPTDPATWRSLGNSTESQVRVTVDNRDPWPHPWAKFLPTGWQIERGVLETGDFALSAIPAGAVVERKTPTDIANCIGRDC